MLSGGNIWMFGVGMGWRREEDRSASWWLFSVVYQSDSRRLGGTGLFGLLKEQKARTLFPCLLRSQNWSTSPELAPSGRSLQWAPLGMSAFLRSESRGPFLETIAVVTSSCGFTALSPPLAWLIDWRRRQIQEGLSDYNPLESASENKEWCTVPETGFAYNM